MTPIFEKESTDIPTNYRPISLTCVLCQILERSIAKKLYNYFFENNLLSKAQFGFISGKSSNSQLLIVFNNLLQNFDFNVNIDIIHTDMQKHLIQYPHLKLISVLKSYVVQCN